MQKLFHKLYNNHITFVFHKGKRFYFLEIALLALQSLSNIIITPYLGYVSSRGKNVAMTLFLLGKIWVIYMGNYSQSLCVITIIFLLNFIDTIYYFFQNKLFAAELASLLCHPENLQQKCYHNLKLMLVPSHSRIQLCKDRVLCSERWRSLCTKKATLLVL